MAEPAARFAAALARLLPGLTHGSDRLGLAVSGGADSLAMLLLAHAAIPGRFAVATVNHGLRDEAAAECALVQQVCAARAIPCTVLAVAVSPGNVQAEARVARYAALAQFAQDHALTALATAHQADDQIETVLMRLARGSGVAGLAGVRERGLVPGSTLPLVRPMLGITRAECEALVAAEGIAWVRDPSNQDLRYDRVRMRQALVGNGLLPPERIAASAAACADADRALEWAADREWAGQVDVVGGTIRYRAQAPRAIAMRVAARAVAELGGSLRGSQAAEMVDILAAGGRGNFGGVLAWAEAGQWHFTAEPPRRA